MLIDRRLVANFDFILLGLILAIPALGLLVLYSAGYDPELTKFTFSLLPESIKSAPFVKQSIYLLLGLLVIFASLFIPPSFLERWSYVFYFMGLILLTLVLVPSVGVMANGARRWFALGAIHFQPSEAMKIFVILALARYLSRCEKPAGGMRIKNLIIPAMMIGMPMVYIVNQPDLGTALTIGVIGFGMLLFVGIHPRSLLTLAVGFVLAALPAWNFLLRPYQKRRILSLVNPDASPLESGYHIVQSKIAVGSGSLFGKGFMQGTQTQLGFIPEHTTDFVFSVWAEEWGFVGSIVLLVLYFFLLYRILLIAGRHKDLFCNFLCVGVAALIFFHTFVNIGMVIGVLPVVGLTLPLFSYGGSSTLSFCLLLGFVLGISMRRFVLMKH